MHKIFTIILFFIAISLYGQNKKVDSLLALIKEVKTPEDKLKTYKKLSTLYWDINPDSSIVFANKMIEISKKYNNKIGEIDAHTQLGMTYIYKSDTINTHKHIDIALQKAKAIDYKKGLINVYLLRGISYNSRSNYYKSFKSYNKALKIAEETNNLVKQNIGIINIGVIYEKIGDYEKSIRCFEQALALSKKTKDKNKEAHSLLSLGSSYAEINKINKAKQSLYEAIKIYEPIQEYLYMAYCYNYLAEANIKENNYQEAITNNTKALALLNDVKHNDAVFGEVHLTFSKIYLNKGNIKKTEVHAEKAYNHFYKINDKLKLYELSETLYKAYKEDGNIDKKSYYAEKFVHYNNLVKAETVNSNFYKEQINYEVAKLEKQQEQEAINYKQKRNLYIAGIVAFFCILLSLILYFNNIKIKKAYEKVEESNSIKTKFLAKISHEIKTPLNAVLGYSNLLSESKLSSGQKQFITNINTSANRLLEMTKDILDFSNTKNKKLKLKLNSENLKELITHVVDVVSLKLKDKAVTLNYNYDEKITQLIAVDKLKLQQILFNLLLNAEKFTSKGTITLTVNLINETPKHYIVEFKVEDTGIGIKKENQAKIFEEFYQETNDYTTENSGTGLGLSISQQLLMLMNSELQFYSKPNVGSTFYFKLQLEKIDLDTKTILNKVKEKIQLSETKTILIVEDNPVNMLLIKKMIQIIYANVNILEAKNGKEGIDASLQYNPDLILMDIQMPILDGYEATKQIRKIQGDKTPIFAVTASVIEENIKQFKDSGMNGHIEKPLSIEALRDKLTVVLN